MTSRPTASIIILTYNNLEYTRLCLESIYAKTEAPDFELILVDNASTDGTPVYLKAFAAEKDNVKLILNQENAGFPRGNNQGLAIAEGQYLVLLNNDTVVTEGWLSGLIRHLQDATVGMVGPVTNSSGNETRIAVEYQDLEEMPAFALAYTRAHQGQSFEISMLPFHCVAIRKEIFEQTGQLDERFNLGMFEDDDYAIRLQEQGLKLLCAEDVFIHHWGSASFSTLGRAEYRRLFEENRQKFEQKWGRPWQPHLYRSELQRQQVNEMIRAATWREEEISARDALISQQHQVIAQRNQMIAERNQTIDHLEQRANQLIQNIGYLEWRLQNTEASLNEILTSTSWRITRKLRYLLAPPGGQRERTLRRLSAVLQGRHVEPMISWESYAFYRFKQARRALILLQPGSIQISQIPGLVSIILPVYNGEDYIREALESILGQTYPQFELIIVDDGSKDATPLIIEAYARQDERITVIHQSNQRLPAALNTGFQQARGEYLTWTSADNRLKPEFLAQMVACMKRHPDWDALYANIDIIDDDGNPLRNSGWYSANQKPPGSEHIHLPVDTSELNIIANNSVGSAFMYRNQVDFLLGGYSPRRFGTEDYDYWMRVNALFTLRHADFDDPVYEYRFHGTSLTARDEELGITRSREALMVFEEFRRDFYNSTLAWLVACDDTLTAQALAKQIRETAHMAGQIVLEDGAIDAQHTHRYWFPLAAVMVTSNPAAATLPENWPAQAYPVLVATGNAHLPESIEPAWRLCVAAGEHSELPRLAHPRQGWLKISHVSNLCAAVDIRVKSLQSELLEAEIYNPTPPAMKISVVICTHRRGKLLAEAINSVIEQTFSSRDYEILIVNNDPYDKSVARIVQELRESKPADRMVNSRLINCYLKGLSHARNAGISEARGVMVCFLDDDAVAFPDWLENTWQAYQENPQAGVIGGSILLDPPSPRPRWAKPGWDHYWSARVPEISATHRASNWREYPWGANWSATRQALLSIGGFRTRYGRRGDDFSGGEELIAASLIERLGYQVIIAPAAKVFHRPHPSRYSLRHVSNTVKEGWLGIYRQQIDLYLPEKPDLPTLRQLRRQHLHHALFARGIPFYSRLESYFLSDAISAVIRRARKDYSARQKIYKEITK